MPEDSEQSPQITGAEITIPVRLDLSEAERQLAAMLARAGTAIGQQSIAALSVSSPADPANGRAGVATGLSDQERMFNQLLVLLEQINQNIESLLNKEADVGG